MTGRIVAIGGLSPDHDDTALHRFIRESAQATRPRVCYVPVASGDYERFVELFYEQYPGSECEPTHLELLRDVPRRPMEVLAEQDVVYIGGGSTPILLGALRVHGLDRLLRELWEAGGVLCGDSAGAHIWFQGCVTDSLGPNVEPFSDGLGFVAGSCLAHVDDVRAEVATAALLAGVLPGPAWGVPDGTALVLEASQTVEAVTSRGSAAVVRLDVAGEQVNTSYLEARLL